MEETHTTPQIHIALGISDEKWVFEGREIVYQSAKVGMRGLHFRDG
jgi:hypothetical protein